ncbi:regulator of (H+)-ATPase in vacuolar membrane [Sporothrix stenoceras]|uniref:Regulator of (H+)-ATPase in vacuolar membrane n=1 Tax=Sporothrix stenoceras TaxID=5173 RepID=A0ABR3YGI8_9PEZI
MKAVLPGKPEPRLQALATGFWDSQRVIVYITGNALAILSDYKTLQQTIYDDDESPLEAVAFDETSGRIATCTDRAVRVYQPVNVPEGPLRWVLECTFTPDIRPPASSDDARTKADLSPMVLSWGASKELVVGHHALALYHTGPSPACLWSKSLGNVVQRASFSYDSSYIACVGYADSLVKVWRRLSFDSDNARFDFFYLQHPQPVTNLQWRAPYHVGHTIDHVLYTFCVDNMLRIWTKADVHSTTQQQLFLWGTVDLAASLQAAALSNGAFAHNVQWAFIIQGRDLSAATERAVQERDETSEKNAGALQHLVNIANRSSEICLVLDARGALAALSLENLDTKSQRTNDIYNITHLVSPDLDFSHSLSLPSTPHTDHVEIQTFCDSSNGHLHILLHYFTGKIEVYEANVALLFDETSSGPRLWCKGTWSGHSGLIRKMVRNFSGGAVVSRTHTGEGVVWSHTHSNKGTPLSPKALLVEQKPIRRICVLRKGRFVVFLFDASLAVWDCRNAIPTLLGCCDYAVAGEPLCLLVLPRERAEDGSVAHIATVTSEKQGVVWEIVLPKTLAADEAPAQRHRSVADAQNGQNGQSLPSVSEFCRFDLGDAGDLAYMLPVDPAGANPVISGFLDVFARDVAISYTKTGRVEFWTVRLNRSEKRVDWLSTSSMETGIQDPSLVSGSTRKKAALVNDRRSIVTIWDIQGAQLEYESSFESHDTVQDLDWTSTPDSQSILAVGFPHRVLLLSQLRYDYLNKGPAWAVVRVIDIREQTPHPIGDSTWLGDGDLVIGAGNQLLVHDRLYSVPNALITSLRLPQTRTRNWDLFDVVQRLNGPLPVFHPQFLSQCMLAGKNKLVQQILMSLHKVLKFSVQGDVIDDYLGMVPEDFYESGRRAQFEVIARNEYAKSELKNPNTLQPSSYSQTISKMQ